MKKAHKFVIIGLLFLTIGCSNNGITIPIEQTQDEKLIKEIMSEEQNKINVIGDLDDTFKLNGVTEDSSSSHIANIKYELNLDTTILEGNKYDPSEVDISAQFISPSKKVYEMPGFWYTDYNRSFTPLDETQEFILDASSYFAQGSSSICGVLDNFEGSKKPVAKITFGLGESSASGFAGAVINKNEITDKHDTLSFYLRKNENFSSNGICFKLFGTVNGNSDSITIPITDLSTDWKRYTFKYSELEHSSSTPLLIKQMYSAGISTYDGSTALGDIYISNMTYFQESFPSRCVTLSSFIANDLKKYRDGDLMGSEVLTKADYSTFKIRFRLTEPGEWTYRIVGKKNYKTKFTYTSKVTAIENENEEENRGLIRVEETQKRNFKFEDGTPYMPIGINVPYSVDPKRGSYDYEVFFPKMHKAGMNFARCWLTKSGYGATGTSGGILNFDLRQDRSYIFDRVLEYAAQYNLYLEVPMMVISPFRLDKKPEDSYCWDSNEYNVINGGYLTEPQEFITDSRAREDVKKTYRYYIARYSYSRYILNWELMNEIGMDSTWYNEDAAKEWAEEIGSYMHTADPYNHLVSISSGNNPYDKVYSADAVDFVSFHCYVWGSNYAVNAAQQSYELWKYFNKPVLVGEMGASGVSEAYNYAKDPQNLMLRQLAWTAPMGGGASASIPFWWQQIDKYDYYSHVTPAINYYKLLPNDYNSMDTVVEEDLEIDNISVKGYGFISKEACYLYVTNTKYNFSNPEPTPIANIEIKVKGLTDGDYSIRIFDTQLGVVSTTIDAKSMNGQLSLSINNLSKDIAYLIEKNNGGSYEKN